MSSPIPVRVFLDANILFDVLNKQAPKHKLCKLVYNHLLKHNSTLYASPTSFAINFYLAGKHYRNKLLAKKSLIILYSEIKFSREDYILMEKVMTSSFEDLEDAIQYYSAEDARVDCIITQNKFDYPNDGLAIFTPEEFIYKYFPL